MAKDYTLNSVAFRRINLYLLESAYNPDTGKYHIGKLTVCLLGLNGGAEKQLYETKYLGAGQSIPYTQKETYTEINNYSNLNTLIASTLKDMYLELINVDLSA